MSKRLSILLLAAALPLLFLASAGTAAGGDPLAPPAGSVFNAPSGYALGDSLAPTVADPPPSGSMSHLLWGYEAAFTNARLFAWTFAPFAPVAQCVPTGPNIPPSSNGRGVAFDPIDGNLWISRLTGFAGDGQIHKVTPPNVTPGVCKEI